MPPEPTRRAGAGRRRPHPGRAVAAAASSVLAAAVVAASAGAATASPDTGPGYDPVSDKGSLYNIAEVVGAHDAYRAGLTGKGVGVALIDTGVAAVAGLTSGNVVQGPDLSFDSQDPATAHTDGFGHGTHLASIIAGRDAAGAPASYADPQRFAGIAPDATLLDVKVGSANGAVDVSQVIAGIDWVVQHAGDNGMHIKVINLSYGTDAVQDSSVDPLAFAVENAWKHGIVVVAAGGNDGQTSKTLADPASDPHVLAVGALDDAGTTDPSDDTVPPWSTHGTTSRHVDVVAPGISVLGLRDPGSLIDRENPQAQVADRLERGSGTSMAAAVVSGEVALLLQAKPDLTPDQVKGILTSTATGLPRTAVTMGGKGTTDLRKALDGAAKAAPVPDLAWGDGSGSLEAARGSAHVYVGEVALSGEQDFLGTPWDGTAWAAQEAAKHAWKEGTWRGQQLTGKGWKDRAWQTTSWTGSSTGDSADDAPSTAAVSQPAAGSDTWRGQMWRGQMWRGQMWRGQMWRGQMWRSESFDAASWGG